MDVHDLHFSSAADTDVGKVRTHNEDSILSRPEVGFWAVADGMGGHDAGDYASQYVTNNLAQLALPENWDAGMTAVETALLSANRHLRDIGKARGPDRIIGCTVVTLWLHGDRFLSLWAGDSRLYRLRNGRMQQLTKDHSHVQELVDMNLLAPEEAEHHPQGNVLTRALGAQDDLRLGRISGEVLADDVFLICSDGLYRMVSEPEIEEILVCEYAEEAVPALMRLALERGAKDNVSIVVVQCDSDDRTRIQPRV